MRLAAILGTCLLWLGPGAGIMRSGYAAGVSPSTQSQENPQSDSPPKNSAEQAPADQQKAPTGPTAPTQAPSMASPACPENLQPGSGAKPDCKPTGCTAAKTKKHNRSNKAATPAGTPADATPPKTVVRNGGTADPSVDLSPGVNPQQASHQKANTNQLLATSDANLKKIAGHPLSASQQDTVKQIKSYMEQAKDAANDGDVQRAYNLALKANLLSADLAGH
jgi:hypothetical protein